MRINLIWNCNNINNILNLYYNNKFNSYVLLFVFFWGNINIWNFLKKKIYYNKFTNNKFIPIIYNLKKKNYN